MRSDSVKNMSAYADQNHAPSLTDVRLELYTENLSLPVFVLIFAYKKDTCQNMSVPLLALRPCLSVGLPLNNFHFSKNKIS